MAQLHIHCCLKVVVLHVKFSPHVRGCRRRIPHEFEIELSIFKYGKQPWAHNHQYANIRPAHLKVCKAAQRKEAGFDRLPCGVAVKNT